MLVTKLPLSHPLWFVSIGLVDNLQILLTYTFNSRVFILLNHTAVVFSILILHIHVTVLLSSLLPSSPTEL